MRPPGSPEFIDHTPELLLPLLLRASAAFAFASLGTPTV